MKLSILMPAHNEVQTVAEIVERVLTVQLNQEIVIIDDGSSDGTSEVIDKLASSSVKVIHHATNKGKGAAIRTGLEAATGDVIVIQDADLEYDPYDLLRLIEPIRENRANVVYGVRSLASQKWIMRMGNKFVTRVTNLLYSQRLKDMETCYKMMKRELALSLDLECNGFEIEAEVTAKLLRAGEKIYELPISYTARKENKKLSPVHGLPTVRALWKYHKWKS
ncbi:glycosyltransferase family 2 protein [Bacteroidota bacterium]